MNSIYKNLINLILGAGKGVFATETIPQLVKVGTFWGYKNSKTNVYDDNDDTKYRNFLF